MNKSFYTINQTAETLKVHRTYISNLIKNKKLAGQKIGRSYNIPKENIEKLVKTKLDLFYTIEETAELLKVNPVYIRRLIKEKRLKTLKIGKFYRISKTDLQEFTKGKPAPFYTVDEAASLLRVNRSYIINLIKNIELSIIKIGRFYRISQKDLKELSAGRIAPSYTIKEIAKLLKVNRINISRLISQKRLKALKIGRFFRIRQFEIDEFLETKAAALYTIDEVAKIYQVSRGKIVNLIKRGELGYVKIGKLYRVVDPEIDKTTVDAVEKQALAKTAPAVKKGQKPGQNTKGKWALVPLLGQFSAGYLMALISLFFGFVFFLYSMKYYISIIMVTIAGIRRNRLSNGYQEKVDLTADGGKIINQSDLKWKAKFEKLSQLGSRYEALGFIYKNSISMPIRKSFTSPPEISQIRAWLQHELFQAKAREIKRQAIRQKLSQIKLFGNFARGQISKPVFKPPLEKPKYLLVNNGRGRILNHQAPAFSEKPLDDSQKAVLEKLDKPLKSEPFVSIHLPFYNEKRVVNRILSACTRMDYKNYEVVVADDSTDETVQIVERWQDHPRVKISHRKDREGFKGGALKYALEKSDPRTEFVIIFDADFVPYPDTIKQFLNYFNMGLAGSNGNGKNGLNHNLGPLKPNYVPDGGDTDGGSKQSQSLISILRSQIDIFESQIAVFKSQIKALKSQASIIEPQKDMIRDKIDDLNESITVLNTKICQLNYKLEFLIPKDNQPAIQATPELVPAQIPVMAAAAADHPSTTTDHQPTAANYQPPADYQHSNLAAVQGYQWHVLNKNENWITRGIRTEYAGSYVVERPGTEVFSSLKQIAGSVYMIRADVLRKYGWGTSITEDFELTLRLYRDGYKVLFTPYIQTPAECPSTLKRLIKQRMRWAEGHTHNIRKRFWQMMRSKHMNWREKLELLYLSPYYLQAAFFLLGTICWLISDGILHVKLPFWTALWGWSLVFTNFFALPLMNAMGLFMEESEKRDYLGIFSFIILSYIIVPFQAYAALKGLLEKDEGTWFRTPKTGHITDTFFRSRFARWFKGLLPGARATKTDQKVLSEDYLKLTSANNQFNQFAIPHKRLAWLTRSIIAFLIISAAILSIFAKNIPTAIAANPTAFYLHDVNSNVITSVQAWQLQATADITDSTTTQFNSATTSVTVNFHPGATYSTAGTPGTPTNYGWIYDTPFGNGGSIAAGTWTFYWDEQDTDVNWTCNWRVLVFKVQINGGVIVNPGWTNILNQAGTADFCDGAGTTGNFTSVTGGATSFSANDYLYVEYWGIYTKYKAETVQVNLHTGPSHNNPRVVPPTVQIPENYIILLAIVPFLPWIVKRLQMKKILIKEQK